MAREEYRSYFPLNNTFAAVAILGLMVSSVMTYQGMLDLTWGVTFILFFTILFISSLITLRPTIYRRH